MAASALITAGGSRPIHILANPRHYSPIFSGWDTHLDALPWCFRLGVFDGQLYISQNHGVPVKEMESVGSPESNLQGPKADPPK